MLALTSARSHRRLTPAWALAVAASALFTMPATPAQAVTGCEPTADVPRYNSYTHSASAGGYVRCSGYYEISLVTSSGATLATRAGNYVSPLTVYTNWTSCPSGTSVHTYIYEKATVQGNTYIATATSASLLCP